MKKKNRIFAFLLIMSLLCSLVPATAVDNPATGESANVTQVQEFVTEFLNQRARNEWLYEQNDLTQYLYVQNPNSSSEGNAAFSTPLQTFLNLVDFYRSHRIFVGKQRTNFTTAYDFQSVTIEGNSATVRVSESLSYLITNGNGEPSASVEEYCLTLQRQSGAWRVSDIDITGDPLYTEYKNTNFQQEVMAQRARNVVLGIGETMTKTVDGEALMRADTQQTQSRAARSATTIVSYNPSYAAAYANIYTSVANDNSCYNAAFTDFTEYGGDCANFASQCIWAGFGGDNTRANSSEFPKDMIGNSLFHWHCEKSPESHSDMWTAAYRIGSYAEYMNTAAQTENGWYASVYSAESAAALPSDISLIGSVFLVRGGNGGNYQHAIFISSASSNNPSDIYYCAHTNNALNVCLAESAYMTCPIKIVRPLAYRRYNASCAGHTYTTQASGNGYDSICNRCGESRMLFTLAWNYGTVNTAKVINATERNSQRCYKLVLEVQNSNGQVLSGGTFTATNAASVGGTYSFSATGLYTVRLKAWDSYESYTNSPNTPTNVYTYAIRIR